MERKDYPNPYISGYNGTIYVSYNTGGLSLSMARAIPHAEEELF